MTDERTTGTPPTDDGDAAASTPTTGTPGGDGRDADSSEPDYKAMYLASKDKIEEANRLKAENDALRMRADQPPADQDDDEEAPAGDDGNGLPTKVDWARVQDYASRGDEVAKAQIENRILIERLARNTSDTFTLKEIDKAEQAEVKAHYQKNRHRLADIKAARAEVRERKLDAENQRLTKELEAARKQPPTDVVRTHSREVSSTEAKARKMSYAEFDQRQAELIAQGKRSEARALSRKLSNDEIELH